MIVNFLAPGGAGKSAVIKSLVDLHSDRFTKPVSYTSRLPRVGERDGLDYHFRSKELILNLEDKFALHETHDGIVYANRASTFLQPGKIILSTLRPAGIVELERFTPQILVIHIIVSINERILRMRSRGDAELLIQERLYRDELEMSELACIALKSTQIAVNGSRPLKEVVAEISTSIDEFVASNQ
jgi:guanylate kinase